MKFKVVAMQQRFRSFIVEQFPFAYKILLSVWQECARESLSISELRKDFISALKQKLTVNEALTFETTPFVMAKTRIEYAYQQLLESMNGFFEREEIKASFSQSEKLWMLQGMILTRAVDNRLKRLFLSGEMHYQGKGFQGKGFRSLGQEAIYAAALKLYRGQKYQDIEFYKGDIVAPLIRDLGVILAFTDDDVELALNGQVGKEGLPMSGKDLHVGDIRRGVLPPAAPLAIGTCTAAGMAFAMQLRDEKRIAVSFIGEGGSSLGEWHEAINWAASRQLPMIFCLQNNQTALSTSVREQSNVRVFGEKAIGYGLSHVSLDGTNPEGIAAGFAFAAQKARAKQGPFLIELISMRMCGHAHHDDMLYLGHEPELTFDLPVLRGDGYVDPDKYLSWSKRDPIKTYAAQLQKEGVCSEEDVRQFKKNALEKCEDAVDKLKARSWPKGLLMGSKLEHCALQEDEFAVSRVETDVSLVFQPEFSAQGSTFLEAICQGTKDILSIHDNAFVIGEDVGPPYGNAFMIFKSLMNEFGPRFVNMPIAESAIIGACVGLALEGMRPIGEMQFNDFVASGFNQLVNNAAKVYDRFGAHVPMVLRMPWGGLRRAGPYHSQDTAPWFYRTAGLKIVVPSTPYDARALLQAAFLDPDPVLFYEHIALYRDPTIRQNLEISPGQVHIGKAAFRRLGTDLSVISYGAYIYRALHCAQMLSEKDGASCDVLDLRCLAPLDFEAIFATVKRTGRVLLVGEDSKKGSILESVASQIAEKAFAFLDAPVRVLGALNAPVPYAPSLEDVFLVSDEYLLQSAREILAW
jgi:2-oxoisovalerate dehydrogenase E1 component